MSDGGMYGPPVIPGPGGARRPRVGEPGHLERLLESHSVHWPAGERAAGVPVSVTRELPVRGWRGALRLR